MNEEKQTRYHDEKKGRMTVEKNDHQHSNEKKTERRNREEEEEYLDPWH